MKKDKVALVHWKKRNDKGGVYKISQNMQKHVAMFTIKQQLFY